MMQKEVVSMDMPTPAGIFRLHVWDGKRGSEMLALTTQSLDPGREVTVRVHSECLTGDAFHSLTCDCGPQKDLALEKIQQSGNGIFIYHRQEGRNVGLFKKVQAYNLMQQGMDTHQALIAISGHPDPRDYADVLEVLGALLSNHKSDIRLLTNSPYKALFLQRYGYQTIIELVRTEPSLHNAAYTDTKTQKFLHNSIGFAPYASVTLARADIAGRSDEIIKILKTYRPLETARKLFIGILLEVEGGDLRGESLLKELKRFHREVRRIPQAFIVFHTSYPASRKRERELKRFLEILSFPYSLQFRLPYTTSGKSRVDVDLIHSLHAQHVIFQLKTDQFYLLEQESFVDYFSSPNKFILLDESFGRGIKESASTTREKLLQIISHGLSRVGVAGGYSGANAREVHELEDYFKIPVSVDAESKLRTNGKLDAKKVAAYLGFFFPLIA